MTRVMFCVLTAALLNSCASVSVYNKTEAEKSGAVPPEKLYVVNFVASKDLLRVDRSPVDLEKFRSTLSAEMTKETILRLNKYVLPTEAAEDLKSMPRQAAWAVTGRFEKVEQGSRAMRILLGFGAGKTMMETYVVVYDLSGRHPRPVMSFRTQGGSNLEGGILLPIVTAPFAPPVAAASIVTLMAPLPSVSMSAAAGSAGLTMDVRRTARQITAVISSALSEREIKTQKKKMHPKRKGKIQQF